MIFIIMNLQEQIDRINQMMTEGKGRYVSRDYTDQEYEEEYPKWEKIIIKFLSKEIDAYDENDKAIILFNTKNNDKTLIRYNKDSEELYFDYSLGNNFGKLVPQHFVFRHFKYAVQDFFLKHFPDYGVYRITAANITTY